MKWTIYKHTNKINNMGYVGYTSREPQRRWQKNGMGYRNQPKFYNAILKYGWNNFDHEILETLNSEEEAIARETYFKLLYNTIDNGYNIVLDESKNPFLGQHHTDETKHKISLANKGRKAWNKGLPRTNEVKQKISRANKGKIRSEECKQKNSLSNRGRHSQLSDNQVLDIFHDIRSQHTIAKEYNINRQSVAQIKSGKTFGWLTGKLYVKSSNAKLTEQQVLDIYNDPRKISQIAKDYSFIKLDQIRKIKNGTAWSKITGQTKLSSKILSNNKGQI